MAKRAQPEGYRNNGLIPRSIVRTIQRFLKEVSFSDSSFAIYEFRISRYIAIASLQCFFFLIICPWAFQFLIKFLISYCFQISEVQQFALRQAYGVSPTTIFLNFHQQERAFGQIQTFSQQVYFETLFESFQNPSAVSKALPKGRPEGRRAGDLLATSPYLMTESVQTQTYFLKCASFYNKQSISIITNWILDFTTLVFFFFLLIFSTPQILILKTFCIESLLSLSETTKCFFLIFFLDLLVGFHSSKSWEIFLQFFIEHFGIYQNQNFIAFFISTFPVLLDTIFKYWIFRYLNKISPSTVATYQAMIE
uniref:Envelope membrane protein n=1 Tax=Rhipiliopsis peltata TaxID=2320810 RepID=A0A386B196_9CHLO|nr:Envelope membrane protein [Rhipiliopsis peltata]AYC65465.1 Envelope membrane protein [Rhipiliopsis peltata]